MPDRPRLGFIGLGLMGVPMVRRLLGRDWPVIVWNREPERYAEVQPAGARLAGSPAELRGASDIVLLCVLDGNAAEEICFGPQSLVRAEAGATLVIDMSTVNPDRTRALAHRLSVEAGMDWVDAPVSGGPGPAALGQLTIMAGGTEEAVTRAAQVLNDLAANLTHAGPLGAGQTAKILNQAIVGASYVLMAEVLAMAKVTEMDPACLPACLAGGLADSAVLQRIYPQMQARAFDAPKGYARQLDKDLADVAAFAHSRRLDLPVLQQAIARYHAYAAGHGTSDSASISLLYDTA